MGYTRKYGQTTRNYNNNNNDIKKKSSSKQQDLVCSIHADNKGARQDIANKAEAKGISEGQYLRQMFQDREATSRWIDQWIETIERKKDFADGGLVDAVKAVFRYFGARHPVVDANYRRFTSSLY